MVLVSAEEVSRKRERGKEREGKRKMRNDLLKTARGRCGLMLMLIEEGKGRRGRQSKRQVSKSGVDVEEREKVEGGRKE